MLSEKHLPRLYPSPSPSPWFSTLWSCDTRLNISASMASLCCRYEEQSNACRFLKTNTWSGIVSRWFILGSFKNAFPTMKTIHSLPLFIHKTKEALCLAEGKIFVYQPASMDISVTSQIWNKVRDLSNGTFSAVCLYTFVIVMEANISRCRGEHLFHLIKA